MRVENIQQLIAAKKLKAYPISRILVISILITGIAIRLINYFSNPGLWLDEALLALNLIEKSFYQLFFPLDLNQVAPVLLLVVEKLSILIFGPEELALRLFPLLCSVLSLPLFFYVAKELMKDDKPALIGLFIFALTPLQIRYSAEVKQYMTDEFISLLLLWLFQRFRYKRDVKALVWLGGAGLISIFFSHIAVLILFTISIFWFLSDYKSKQISQSMVAVLALWFAAFSVYYLFFIFNHTGEEFMLTYWKNHFMPLNPFKPEFWQFFYTNGYATFFKFLIYNNKGMSVNMNFIISLTLLVLFLCGLFLIVARHKYTLLYFLYFPVILHLFLSGINRYPFETRFALYLSPFVIMSVSYGLDRFRDLSIKLVKKPWPGLILILLVLMIFPYKLGLYFPVKVDGARDCMQFINKNYKEGQPVYIPYYSYATFLYYKKTGRLIFGDVLIPGTGIGSRANWDADLKNLKAQKGEVWLLFSHLYANIDPMHIYLKEELKKQGKIKLSFRSKISAAYLMDLDP